MSNKDFLSQFSDENKKPDSFKEEERIPVKKEKKPIKPIFLVVPIVVLLISLALIYFVFLRPNIEVVNFTGKTKEEATSWLRQQEIESQGIVFKEEYNFDVVKDTIISQDPIDGRVKKDAKMTFVVSLGPNPDDKVSFVDIKNMSREEIDSWIATNKLLSAKITTSFSEEVENGKVISYTLSGCEEDTFTRGCTLKISISKGDKPAEEIKVENFVNKYFSDVETWAKTNKIEVKKSEVYSTTAEVGKITYQSVASGKKMKAGDILSVSVSKGPAIVMPDFYSFSEEEIDRWNAKNQGLVSVRKQYSESKAGKVIDYSPKAGTVINEVEDAYVVVSLGNTVSLGGTVTVGSSTLMDLQDLVAELNKQGAHIRIILNENSVYSENYKKNVIVSIECKANSTACSISNAIPVGSIFDVTVSKGLIISLLPSGEDTGLQGCKNGEGKYITQAVVDYLTSKGITFENNTENEFCSLELTHEGQVSGDLSTYYEGDVFRINMLP